MESRRYREIIEAVRQRWAILPMQRLWLLLLAIALGVQVIVIVYNHFSGFYPLYSPLHFVLRLLRGTWLSWMGGVLVALPDLLLIGWLNVVLPWAKSVLTRVLLQLSLTILWGASVSVFVTLLAHAITPYSEDLGLVLWYNALMYSVVNVLLMVVLEGWIFFLESRRAEMRARLLERELSQVRFEVLKSQINPHFMFNSLAVLSGLMEHDVGKAQLFLDHFSQIYRYVLDTIEKQVVTLQEELKFAHAYLLLQQMRHGESLTWKIDLPSRLMHKLMPPLSLQTLLENAIKHNIANERYPLTIEIFSNQDELVVRNKMQPKLSQSESSGLGQRNLEKRYRMISEREPRFVVETDCYVATLPLIESENEGVDH